MIHSERKAGIFVVRSDARLNLNTGARKAERLITNAVAVSYLSPIPELDFPLLLSHIKIGQMGTSFHASFTFLIYSWVFCRLNQTILRLLHHQNLGRFLT